MFQFTQKSVFDPNTCTLNWAPITGTVDLPFKRKKSINTCTTFFCMYWYVSIYSEECFWPQYMYSKLSPNNGYRWCPLGKLSHLGLEQITSGKLDVIHIFAQFKKIINMLIKLIMGSFGSWGLLNYYFSSAFWVSLSMLYRFLGCLIKS